MTDPRQHQIKRYGWIPDLPDARDHMYTVAPRKSMPLNVDLRAKCPAVYDQGDLGSCTANAIAGAIQFDRMKQNLSTDFVPSRLFIYYNERVIEHSTPYDSGATLRDGIKTVSRQGVCPEADWPYDINKFAIRPPAAQYQQALQTLSVSYSRLRTSSLSQFKNCLASGYPFVFGFTVYDSFESGNVATTGIVPMPASTEYILGGHAVLAVGYDDTSKRFIVRNSWGKDWGMSGYCTMPYDYLTNSNLADDMWTIRMISG